MSRENTSSGGHAGEPDRPKAGARVMRDFLAARESERARRAAARKAAIEAALPELAAILEAHGARRAWVFGSFVHGPFDEHSDLDLAVEGLPATSYFQVRADLSEVCPVRFDLVQIERAMTGLREEILAHGRLLVAPGQPAEATT